MKLPEMISAMYDDGFRMNVPHGTRFNSHLRDRNSGGDREGSRVDDLHVTSVQAGSVHS